MEIDSPLSLLALIISWACFTLIAIIETSILSIGKERLQQLYNDGISGADRLKGLYLSHYRPDGILKVIKVGFLTSGFLSSNILVIEFRGMSLGWIILSAITVLLVMSATQIGAVLIARWKGETICLLGAPLVQLLLVISSPILSAFDRLTHVSPLSPTTHGESPGDDVSSDIRLSIQSAGEPLDDHEVQMIRGVVRLDRTTAREIMIPRVDMIAAEIGAPLDTVAETMMNSGYSRIPVYAEDLDHIQGIAYARDVLGHLSREGVQESTLTQELIRPALFIPESKTLEELLKELQDRRVHISIVVDEHGGVSGLVTIEDLLEEIVGEIQDEFDVSEPDIEVIDHHEFIMDGRTSIDQFNKLLSLVIEPVGFDTLGGFMYQRLGRIPSVGDLVTYQGTKIEVVSTTGRRIKRLRVTKSG